MKKGIIYTGIIITLITSSCSSSTKNERNEIPEISVAKLISDSVTIYQSYPGTIKANNSVDIVSRVSGNLVGKYYNDGQYVEMGQRLFDIEDTKYRDAVRQAQSALATAKSDYEYAEKQYSAMKMALKEDAVALIQVNKAKNTLEQAEADMKSAQAALATAQTNLKYCHITAPFAGHITAPAYSVGAYIGGETEPVKMATLYDDEILKANFNIEESEAEIIKRNIIDSNIKMDSIPIKLGAQETGKYHGKLVYVSPDVDSSTGTVLFKADIDNKNGDLKDGMYITVNIPIKTVKNAVLVKTAALSTDQLGKYIYAVNDSDEVKYTPVEVGETINDTMTIVVSGANAGTMYVTKALLKVRNGMKIKPVPAK